MISLNYRDSRPIYEQIRDGLRKLIVTGALGADEKLPSVRALAAQLAINPNTIQRAYNELEGEGYIYSVPGKGSFAAANAAADSARPAEVVTPGRELLSQVGDLGGGQQGVLVGRDGSVCGIVFKEGTPGVSAWHCSVVWDGRTGEFLLTDLKSTYGTFLATGQKLTPGVACRLKAGDTFYLGEQSNALRVELG